MPLSYLILFIALVAAGIFYLGFVAGIYWFKKNATKHEKELRTLQDAERALMTELLALDIKKFRNAIAIEIAVAQKSLIDATRKANAANNGNDDEGGSGNSNNGGDKGPYLN